MIFGSLLERVWCAKGRHSDPKSVRPGSTGKGREGVKTPSQREEGFWGEGFFGMGASKPPVAQRVGRILYNCVFALCVVFVNVVIVAIRIC